MAQKTLYVIFGRRIMATPMDTFFQDPNAGTWRKVKLNDGDVQAFIPDIRNSAFWRELLCKIVAIRGAEYLQQNDYGSELLNESYIAMTDERVRRKEIYENLASESLRAPDYMEKTWDNKATNDQWMACTLLDVFVAARIDKNPETAVPKPDHRPDARNFALTKYPTLWAAKDGSCVVYSLTVIGMSPFRDDGPLTDFYRNEQPDVYTNEQIEKRCEDQEALYGRLLQLIGECKWSQNAQKLIADMYFMMREQIEKSGSISSDEKLDMLWDLEWAYDEALRWIARNMFAQM